MIPALANHLWQSTAFALIAALLTLALRENRARIRHAIWFVASLKFLVPWSLLIELGSWLHWHSGPALPLSQPALTVVLDQVSQPFAATPIATPAAPDPLPIILFSLWAVGFIGITVAWTIRWMRLHAIASKATPLDLDLPIRACAARGTMEPGIFGIFRPTLLLPEGITDRLTPQQLTAVISHELSHVRHRDNLTAAVQMFIETVFWFHPLVWWIGKRMIAERELACDEEVLRQGSENRVYAEGLLTVCKLYAGSPLPCASGVSGADLKTRIQVILAGCTTREMTLTRKAILVVTGAIAVATPLFVGALHAATLAAFAQIPPHPVERKLAPPPPLPPPPPPPTDRIPPPPAPPPPPRFEAASIRVHNRSVDRVDYRLSGGRLHFEANSVSDLIAFAYGLKDYQVLGGPEWTGSQVRDNSSVRFDIDAKAEGEETRTIEEFRQLTKVLLADRFHLALHRDSKQLPVYVLVVDKAGPKFKASDAGSPKGMMMRAPRGGGKGWTITSEGGTISHLAAQFSNNNGVDRPVFDETGLTGNYDFNLEWDWPGIPRGYESSAPGVFTAFREQLGLRLEPKNAPVEVLVIDSVEKPDAN